MSLWSRIANVFRADRLSREIDEEMQAHVAEAIEQGRDPSEARRAFGSMLRQREESRDVRLMVWLDSLRADAVFGWRQLKKKKITSAAAILSLALAIGACTSAFRLIDALTRANKPYDLFYLPNRTHAVGLDPYAIQRTWDYFVEHLRGAQPARDFKVEMHSPITTD